MEFLLSTHLINRYLLFQLAAVLKAHDYQLGFKYLNCQSKQTIIDRVKIRNNDALIACVVNISKNGAEALKNTLRVKKMDTSLPKYQVALAVFLEPIESKDMSSKKKVSFNKKNNWIRAILWEEVRDYIQNMN